VVLLGLLQLPSGKRLGSSNDFLVDRALRILVKNSLLTVPVMVVQENDDVVSRDDANALLVRVHHWESMVVALKNSPTDVLDTVDVLKGDQLRAHEVVGSHQLELLRNSFSDDGHLLAAASPNIETSREQSSYFVRDRNGDDDGDEGLDGLSGFHDDDGQRVGHSSVTGHVGSTAQDDVRSQDSLLLARDVRVHHSPHLKEPVDPVSHSTADNDAWQEETSWDVGSVVETHEAVPNNDEPEEVGHAEHDKLVGNVPDDSTLSGKHVRGVDVILPGGTPHLEVSMFLVFVDVLWQHLARVVVVGVVHQESSPEEGRRGYEAPNGGFDRLDPVNG